ncbi:accessory regulator AgrB [Brevibacillus sp. SKDU10]|uniref:accessory gene regulator ArgB-like protein n=1 Tax=Brevibacillus sp. SKDU10 TaxID=1247872 RepID=UPI0007C981B2|nr:accessory gene regulator B family protein [Brevibacillus sp. SKDU10]OAJ75272.1 accessory regulator AgrB [Brevibacillus sp. SKDU10]
MIEKISKKIAILINRTDPAQTSSVAVLTYSISVTINFIVVLMFSILFGYLLGKLADTMMALFSFMILRAFSGGYHFKSLDGCAVVTVAIMSIIPNIPMTPIVTITLTAISMILVLLLAPNNVYDEVRIPKERHLFLKVMSLLIICFNFILYSPILSLSFFVQSILLLPKKEVTS